MELFFLGHGKLIWSLLGDVLARLNGFSNDPPSAMHPKAKAISHEWWGHIGCGNGVDVAWVTGSFFYVSSLDSESSSMYSFDPSSKSSSGSSYGLSSEIIVNV